MNRHSSNQENRRLFNRVEAEGSFNLDGATYTIKDISVGGIHIWEKLDGVKKGSLKDGRVGLKQSGIQLYSDVICEVIDNADDNGAKLKFIEISEEFTEFLRSLELRHKIPTDHKAGWIGSDTYQISNSEDTQAEKSLIARFWGIETIIGLVILALTLVFFIRATTEQNFWVAVQHEIASPVSGEITFLHPDSEISVGNVIANIKITTLTNQEMDFPIVSKVGGQTLNWNFNIGDQVVEEDLLGVINLTPISNGNIKAIIGIQSPFLSLKPGDVVKLSNRAYHSMNALVAYAITPNQAAGLTGMSPDSFRFEDYLLVELSAPADASLKGQPSVDILRSWLHQFYRAN